METRERICGFCLRVCDNFKTVEIDVKDVSDIAPTKIDLAATSKSVMCIRCTKVLMKCFHFKTVRFYTYDCIVPFVNDKCEVKVDLKDVYFRKNENVAGVPEDEDNCGFCINSVKNCWAVSLDVEEGDVTLEKMIGLDSSVIKNPVICASCHGSIKNRFHLVMNCLIVGEKIKKYCEAPHINSNGQTELISPLQFAMIKMEEKIGEDRKNPDESDTVKSEKNVLDDCEGANKDVEKNEVPTGEVDVDWPDIIKVEQLCEEISNGGDTVKLEQTFPDDGEGAGKDAGNINKGFMKTDDQEINNEPQCTLAGAEVSMEDQTLLLNEEIEIKSAEDHFNRFDDNIVLTQSNTAGKLRLYRKEKCSVLNFEKDQSSPHIEHTLTEKHKKPLINDNLIPKRLPVPEYPSEVKVYTCYTCSFQTKHRQSLHVHLLKHKNPSEVKMLKCDSCSYQAKVKHQMRRHVLKHKVPSDAPMYQCDLCPYQTKYKHDLKKHLLRHKVPSDVTMYKCDLCPYQAKRQSNLTSHLQSHKDVLEVTMYKCRHCSFEAKRKSFMKRHLQNNNH